MNLNKALLIGRITKDPDGKTTPSGRAVTTFSVATNKFWTDASGNKQEATEYHNIVTWNKLAEICAQYLVKGQEVYVEGRIQTRSWESKDGIKRYTTEIIADTVQMGSKPQGSGARPMAAPAPAEEVPQNAAPQQDFSGQQAAEPSSQQRQQEYQADGEGDVRIEDLPF